MSGYYLHSRKIFELYINKPYVLAVCEVILYSVRYLPRTQEGIEVGKGQCLLKYDDIAEMCGITVSQVRTAIKRFVTDGGITTENMGKKGMLITLLPAFSCDGEKSSTREKRTAPGSGYSRNTYYNKSAYREKPKDIYEPDPNASYDLKRAEEWAKTHVPVLKKRVR